MNLIIPENVRIILNTLKDNGYDAYVVGGCVRDAILGIEPKDWDITTSAKPDEIKECFKPYHIISVGEQHGTIGVVINKKVYEVTTYRIDGDYSDNRHPESITFTDNLELDLSRRDFTVNAMAYNEDRGLVDPFNGERDLKFMALRCVGEPDKRFTEDALRILRALRFASVYNFSIESNTAISIIRNKKLLSNISEERISSELNGIVCGKYVNFVLRRYKDIIAVFLPEIVSTFDFAQNTPHHNKTVWRHITASVSNIESDTLLRIVMLLHDIGKPLALRTDKKGIDHFKGHNHFGAVLAKTALQRLKYPTKFIEDAVTLIEYHDVRFSDNRKQIKHVINKIGEENFRRLLKVQNADILAQSKYMREAKLNNLDLAKNIFEEILQNNECYKIRDLKINGSDLIHLGITDGKTIGNILEILLDSVIDETIENDSVALKKKAFELYKEYDKII
ncbi:MAG: HD domain-containing protein [Ruminococcus sp.]|nr:HD domain-containing protein [Ruminococcus sp.]